MVDSPSVSVVMGVYNSAELMAETLDSVFNQTFGDFEFIVVNDGSIDSGVQALLEDYANRDSRLVVISRENRGLTRSLIGGCERARGKYIARIDVGDTMAPERLALQVAFMDRFAGCLFVSSHVEVCGPDWESLWLAEAHPVSDAPKSIVNDLPEQGLDGDIPHHGSVMFRASAYRQVGGYRAEFYYGQDWDLWYRLAERGTYGVIPEVLYRARLFPNAISMTNSARQEAIARCSLQGHLARKQGLSDRESLEQAEKIRPGGASLLVAARTDGNYFIGEALRRAGNPACRSYFFSSIRHFPGRPKSYLRLIQSLGLNDQQPCRGG